jgi:pimeloyl-ACP methyl ester carboxylesterase
MTRHVVELLDALEMEVATVVGHSMGGRIAVELGLHHSDRVRRLALINPVGFGPMPHVGLARPFARRGLVALLPTPLPTRIVQLPVSAVYGKVGRPTHQDVAEYRAPTQFRAFLQASAHLLRVFDWSVMGSAELEAIKGIASVVLGARDRVVQTVRSGNVERLSRSGWMVMVVPDVAHVVHEEAPAEVMNFCFGLN